MNKQQYINTIAYTQALYHKCIHNFLLYMLFININHV